MAKAEKTTGAGTTTGGVPPVPGDVGAVLESYPAAVRDRLLTVRGLIYETADAVDGVGPLTETLKWGEPAYLTEATKSGSTIRLGIVKDRPDAAAIFVNCRTSLVDSFRSLAPDLAYQGDRAVLLPTSDPLPVEELRRILALALTYHRDKRTRSRSPARV